VELKNYTSAWLTGRPKALRATQRVLGSSDYQAHAGVYTGGANGVYWLEIVAQRPDGLVVVSNITEGAKRDVESVQAVLEPDFLYPLLRGRDVSRWQAAPSAWILIPRRPDRQEKAVPEDEMKVSFPKTFAYLNRFRDVLDQRRDAVLMRSRGSIPFYSIGAVGDYTFAPYKVVWREQAAGLTVAVVEPQADKIVMPDHKLMLVDCQDQSEAHYLCAALNSSPAQLVVLSYSVTIQMDTHVLENIRVPRFDPANPTHLALADLSRQAHAATAAGDAARVREIELEVDRLAARLWGLTDAELREIQESLAELG